MVKNIMIRKLKKKLNYLRGKKEECLSKYKEYDEEARKALMLLIELENETKR